LIFNDVRVHPLLMSPRPEPVITKRAQLRALASPARQELLDLLSRVGPASVAELGRLIRRPADGLYYHLRQLERVGLVVESGKAQRGGKSEALFRTFHQEPQLRHDPSPQGNSGAVSAIVASMLRLGIRDFRKAALSRDVVTEGPRRELWGLRATGWLSDSELTEVNRRIRSLRSAVVHPARPGARLYSITILITPLDRNRKKQRRAPSARKAKTS
jgi:DNA-binding transcriptional ArsR family regulator